MVRVMIFSLLVCLLTASTVFAEEQTGAAKPGPAVIGNVGDTPATSATRSTAVNVEHQGSDTVGAKMALQLKELMNGSSLFLLTTKDVPKIHVLIDTVPEFVSRPEVGSAYSVVWLYGESEGTLKHFLSREVGIVNETNVTDTVHRLAERTDGIAVKYSYLFSQ